MKTNIHTNPVADFTTVNVAERKDLRVSAGDTVKVWVKIKETSKGKEKTRLQAFEGLVLSTKHGNEPGSTFTVRKVSNGVGVERIFPLFSPMIDKIEVTKRAKVRRAKLYHIREKVARQIKRQMRRASFVGLSTTSDIEEQERIVKEAEAAAEAKAAEEAKMAEEKAAAEAKAAEEEAAKEAEVKTAEEPAEETGAPEETASDSVDEVKEKETKEA